MSPRPYRMGKREADVEDTRDRVIAAAHEVLSEGGFYAASLDDIAKRAGVARATVYYQFKSKLGLMDAVVTDRTQVHRARGLERARRMPDAAEGLRVYIKEICKFWAGDFQLYRNVIGLTWLDPEAEKLMNRYDDIRRNLLSRHIDRIVEQGNLAPGISPREALEIVWLLSSFRTFEHFHSRAGLSVRAAGAALARMVNGILVPGPAT